MSWCCNSASAWGNATGGDSILGSNSDVNGCVCNDPAIILYPSDPKYPKSCHAVMTSNGFISNGIMNDAGICLALTGGQTAQAGDTDPDGGLSAHLTQMFIAARCDTFESTKEDVISAPYPTGVNINIVDSTGKGCVVEKTADTYAVREHNKSVEGDKDYMIENNAELDANMLNHNHNDGSYDDCPYRYATVQYFLNRDYGKITLDTIREAMASTTYVDPKTGKKTDKPAWVNSDESYNSPENVAPSCKTAARMLMDATNRSAYILNGPENDIVSLLPYATGTYFKLSLKTNESDVANDAKLNAYLYVYQAEKNIYASETGDATRKEYLNKAKQQLIIGDNNLSFIGYDTDAEVTRELYSKAVTAYVKAQTYAKAAWNNPHTLFSDYDSSTSLY